MLGNVKEWCDDVYRIGELAPRSSTPWNILRSAPVLRITAGSAWNEVPAFPFPFPLPDRILQTEPKH